MQIEYLEFVTSDVDATCDALAAIHAVSFDPPLAVFGGARIAKLQGSGRIGVRAPLRPDEELVVRPYLRVDDISEAIAEAEAAGAEFAMKATEIPGHGRFAIFLIGGIQHGLWQL